MSDYNIEESLKMDVLSLSRELSEEGLVVRTWGNVSAKMSDEIIAISPSGMSYDCMSYEDVPLYDVKRKTYEGKFAPSSERKVHVSVYETYPEVNYVIHTHQNYATAVGLAFDEGVIATRVTDDMDLFSCDYLSMTKEESEILGSISVAKYALPGTDELARNAKQALETGSKIVFMKNHGILIADEKKDGLIKKAMVLERVCKRYVELSLQEQAKWDSNKKELYMADMGGFHTQIDDMAQLIGNDIICVDNDKKIIADVLNKREVFLVKEKGLVIAVNNESDATAVRLLMDKAIICKLLTLKLNKNADLSDEDCTIMRDNYVKNYSKLFNKD